MAISKVKVSLSQPMAEGRTAEIYPWDDGHILKLYRDWCPSNWVDYESRIAGAVYAAGVPSPAVGPIVEVNGRRGLVYERLEGRSMLQELNVHPWKMSKLARALAELQIQIHRQSIPGLPSYKGRLERDIRNAAALPEDLREKAFAMLVTLPDGQGLCHGDFHPGNILMTKRGPVVIDWMTACAGVPGADVARTLLLCSIGAKAAGKQVSSVARTIIMFYVRAYRDRYRVLSTEALEQADRWMPVIAAARLNENITPEREALIEIVQKAAG